MQDYMRRFKTAQEILESHIGSGIQIPTVTEKNPNWDKSGAKKDANEKCQKETSNRFIAYLFLEQADHSKYGSFLTGLNTQHSLSNDLLGNSESMALLFLNLYFIVFLIPKLINIKTNYPFHISLSYFARLFDFPFTFTPVILFSFTLRYFV